MKHMYQPCEDYTYLNHKFTFIKEAADIFCVFIYVKCFKFKDDESYYHNKLENIVLMQFYEY